jgi:type VI secretion system protein VasD
MAAAGMAGLGAAFLAGCSSEWQPARLILPVEERPLDPPGPQAKTQASAGAPVQLYPMPTDIEAAASPLDTGPVALEPEFPFPADVAVPESYLEPYQLYPPDTEMQTEAAATPLESDSAELAPEHLLPAEAAPLQNGTLAGQVPGAAPMSPAPAPTSIDLTIRAGPDLNLTPSGRPSPVMISVYQLSSPSAFSQVDYFDLAERQSEVLDGEAVSRQTFFLDPGGVERIDGILPPEVRYVGVTAAYRDIQNANWRAVVPVPRNASTVVVLEAGSTGLVTMAGPPGQQ